MSRTTLDEAVFRCIASGCNRHYRICARLLSHREAFGNWSRKVDRATQRLRRVGRIQWLGQAHGWAVKP